MAQRDIIHNVTIRNVVVPIDPGTGNTPLVSSIIDTQGYDSLGLVVQIGVIADADVTFTFLLEDGNNSALSDNTTVAAAFINGTLPTGVQFDSDSTVYKFGYVGNKRYVRLTITPAANTGSWPISAIAILGRPHLLPAA